jgi:voltage-gated potassium channel
MIAGLRRDGAFTPQPPGETVLQAGDVLLAMGTLRTLERLERLFDPDKAEAR